MTMFRLVRRSVPLATIALVSAAPMALAQWPRQSSIQGAGRELFEWTGSVDREKQITMRGDRVWTTNASRSEPRGERSRTMSAIPRQDGRVMVRLVNGRGDVQVIQQPSARNNYSTVVRIIDPRGGSDNYRLAAYWEGYNNSDGSIYSRDRNDRDRDGDRGRGHNEDHDRGRHRGWDNGRGNSGQYGSGDVMHWSGNVDDELEIRLQNGRVEYRTLHGAQPTSIRATTGNASAQRSNGQLSVVQNQGRGSVVVVQQPSSWNGYTTVLRVKDPQGGYGYYDFDLMER